MSAEEDYRLREIQREYLDFLDDDVGLTRMVKFVEVKCPDIFKDPMYTRLATVCLKHDGTVGTR